MRIYRNQGCKVNKIPSDIPAESSQVWLNDNQIDEIEAGTLSNLTDCILLNLDANNLTHITADMWQGLNSLKQLRLWHNLISYIEPGSFESLSKLEGLYLHNNRLTTLEQNVFGTLIPQKLTLILSDNPLVCDSRMCWIKQGEEEGQLTLYEVGGQKPSCEDFPGVPWDDVTIICPTPGKLMWIHSWTTKS